MFFLVNDRLFRVPFPQEIGHATIERTCRAQLSGIELAAPALKIPAVDAEQSIGLRISGNYQTIARKRHKLFRTVTPPLIAANQRCSFLYGS